MQTNVLSTRLFSRVDAAYTTSARTNTPTTEVMLSSFVEIYDFNTIYQHVIR